MKLEEMDPHVPKTVLKDWLRIDKQFQRAKERFDSPEGEFEVNRAESLHYAFTESDAFVGLRVRLGGWKDKNRDEQQAEHQKWFRRAHYHLASYKKPYPRGTKTRIANRIASEFGQKPDTVRKRLREMGVWDQV